MTVELKILCEGPTENNFVRLVLAPHLKPLGVYPRPLPLCHGNYGVVAFETLRKAVQNEVGRLRHHQYVTTMIDLYGMRNFPGDPPDRSDAYQRVRSIEAGMATEFRNPQVIPYIQVHEFEALVFTDLKILEGQYPDGNVAKAVEQLRADVGDQAPELINDGPNTAPSKRLQRYLGEYNKVVDGPAIAGKIGLERLRRACPHFGEWLTRLESLAT